MLERTETVRVLTAREAQELQACEAIVARGLETFFEVGTALLAIRDRRLYRATDNTFEDYLHERWQMSRPSAYRLMDAAQVAENLSPIGDTPRPTHESQLRPLTRLEPEAQRDVWAQAVAESNGNVPTAVKVKEVIAATGGHVRGTFGTGENEWYTPPQYIEMAREVMGYFDLDPASSAKANECIKARCFYSAEDDGLKQNWRGKIWLNPPYAQPLIAQFVDRLVRFFITGEVLEAILLTHNYTDTSWFHRAVPCAELICFTRGRIGFLNLEGNPASPTQGQAFFYYGENPERFREVFCRIGFVTYLVPPAPNR
jgi:ParB family chromosome partitioning protein